ncbi:response regulator transcription factor [Hymenobacter negativus]|uniref:Response regulator transcription factor n=1 Tax=Hymenobacter negativus TaxID=2795026 RepID=A0ABS3QCL7_9BACT|nr:response regulator transcription factor [Hymenobacter negativus]MBO2008763.1 response regulator transcription factor [Hymenobacter negativus]
MPSLPLPTPEAGPARILYAEDDPNLGFVTRDNLERRGYHLTHCADGAEALATFERQPFDLCLLDVMLPGLDGLALARRIRALSPRVPILFLSARALGEDRITGLRTGADDYITKPFSLEELVLRMEVFLKRTAAAGPDTAPDSVLGSYTFDLANLVLMHAAGRVRLTQKEGQLLNLFVQRPGQLLRREEILHQLWGDDDYFLGRSLDVFISRLRKHLRHDARVQLRNVNRVGFVLEVGSGQ